MAVPETHYARTPDGVHIAYQIVGDGPIDLVYCPPPFSHVELGWDDPARARALRRMASFSRLILFDKRGSGASDHTGDLPTLDMQMDDVAAVMDAAHSARAAIFGYLDGGVLAAVFAATHPARASAVALYATPPRFVPGPDYPWGIPEEFVGSELADLEAGFSLDLVLALLAPSRANDPAFQRDVQRLARLSSGPGGYARLVRNLAGTDIRHVIPAIQCPLLFLSRRDDPLFPPALLAYMRQLSPHAQVETLPGRDTLLWADEFDPLIDEVETFVTGVRPAPEPERMLATILMTDIVTSTDHLAGVGDREWGLILERHDALVRFLLRRFGGREIRSTGDGFVAVFDRPARAIECGSALVDRMPELGLAIRAGVHTGECDVRNDDIGGLAVHIAARVMANAAPNELLVSNTVKDLVAGSRFDFEDRGERELRGVPGRWRLLAVRNPEATAS